MKVTAEERRRVNANLPKITRTFMRLKSAERGLTSAMDANDRMREHANGEGERTKVWISNENLNVAELARMGVTFGEPVEVTNSCSMCTWHAENPTEDRSDGGNASAILSWVKEGYLGKPENIVLHPVKRG